MQQRYLIGTVFEQQELNKKTNANNVKLKDPMGNVRWKGAFTGGFEAGFKNTCGSKEGWMPSTFYSTTGGLRTQRKEQSIFDFMDKEDLGREQIGQNISTQNKFAFRETNPLNISTAQSVGSSIIEKMKRKSAFARAPEDMSDLHKLLQNYKQQQGLAEQSQKYVLQGLDGYNSVGANTESIPEDQMIVAYEDFFRKVIRAGVKEETEEEIAKRREQNKIYFDFTRPLEEEPEYLKQIQQVQQFGKPKRRRKNTINDKSLRDLFKLGQVCFAMKLPQTKFEQGVPPEYDPCHRIKMMREKQKQFIANIETKKGHRIYDVKQRSDILNENKLAQKFVSSTKMISTTKFVKASQQQAAKQLQKVFEDREKNKRYWDYVLELEGKKISAQLQCLDYDQAEKEKQEFSKIYESKLRNMQQQNGSKQARKKIEQSELKSKRKITVVRKTGFWRPERLLCKRFGCMLPYKQYTPGHEPPV